MNQKLSYIRKGDTGSMSFDTRQRSCTQGLFLLYGLGVAIFFLIALVQLFRLTIVKGNYYSVLSDDNRVKEIVIEAPRGTIVDRKGVILVSNTTPDISDNDERVTSNRIYKYSDVISHIIGYRQIADTDDLESDSCMNKLKYGDKVGKKGVEQLYECELRGRRGKKLVEIDAHGEYIKTLSVLDPKAGDDLKLALDIVLQEKAMELLGDTKGAVIGLKPDTGDVLILASTPGYDPQIFEDGDSELAKKLIDDKDEPLFNRATEGVYAPGSTFKLFIAAAGLEEKVITPDETIMDSGVLEAGPLKFHNWYYLEYGRTEGEVNMLKALQRSNDIYFYLLGGKLGPEKIKKWAEIFGFQNSSNLGLDEAVGIIPSTFWKQDTFGERWFLGDTYNLSIGQGYVATTPLQIARATAVFANGGYLCDPKVLKVQSAHDASCKELLMSNTTYELIREGMHKACQTGGTGWPFFNFSVQQQENISEQEIQSDSIQKEASPTAVITTNISVGCKTGTAESHAKSGKPHAWFTVFAPFDNPEIVLTVLVEEGGQGSDIAAPIAKEILKVYFERYE